MSIDTFNFDIVDFRNSAENVSFSMTAGGCDILVPKSYEDVFQYMGYCKECLESAINVYKKLPINVQKERASDLLECTYKFRKMSRGLFKFCLLTKNIMVDAIDYTFDIDEDDDQLNSCSIALQCHVIDLYKEVLFQFDQVSRLIEMPGQGNASYVKGIIDQVLIKYLEELMHIVCISNYATADQNYMVQEITGMLEVVRRIEEIADKRLANNG